MKNKILDLTEKLLDKALQEWLESINNTSPEEILIEIEELRLNSK